MIISAIIERLFQHEIETQFSNEFVPLIIDYKMINIDNFLFQLKNNEHTNKLNRTPKRRQSMYTSSGHEEVTCFGEKTRELNTSSTEDCVNPIILNSTPLQSVKRRRSLNLEECLNKVSEDFCAINCKQNEKLPYAELRVYRKFQLTGFNDSHISKLSPLCDSKFYINEENKKDKKMFSYIPFVKVEQMDLSTKMNSCRNMSSLVPPKPIERSRKTPPIKIKSIKNLDKLSRRKKEKSPILTYVSVQDLPKLIVQVERMKFPPKEETIDVISNYQSNIENGQTNTEITRKKKKHVHFNDTPTIIITDDHSDDFDLKNKSDESKKNINIKSIMVSDQSKFQDVEIVDEEKSDNEEPLTLILDSESDESNGDTNRDSSDNIEKNERKPVEHDEELGDEQVEDNEERNDVLIENTVQETEEINDGIHEKIEIVNETDIVEVSSSDRGNEENKNKNLTESVDEESSHIETQIIINADSSRTDQTIKKLDGNEVVEVEEKNAEDEKDSLDGFEVIDQEDFGSNIETSDTTISNIIVNNDKIINIDNKEEELTENVETVDTEECNQVDLNVESNNRATDTISPDSVKEKSSESMDDIDLLILKYCEDNSKENSDENGKNPVPTIEKEKTALNEETSENATEETNEDFGSLIDEVQKCLFTSTTDILDETEVQLDSEAISQQNLIEILDKSFDENDTLPTESVNGNKNLKRKHSNDEIDEQSDKKVKLQNP